MRKEKRFWGRTDSIHIYSMEKEIRDWLDPLILLSQEFLAAELSQLLIHQKQMILGTVILLAKNQSSSLRAFSSGSSSF